MESPAPVRAVTRGAGLVSPGCPESAVTRDLHAPSRGYQARADRPPNPNAGGRSTHGSGRVLAVRYPAIPTGKPRLPVQSELLLSLAAGGEYGHFLMRLPRPW